MSANNVNWASFQEKLADYVRLELAGEAADEIYPEIAFYIQHAPACQAAYDREFRRQGLAKPLEELLPTQRRQTAITTLHEVFAPATSVAAPVQPDWVATTLEYGRAWIDQLSQRWRQVEIVLATLPLGSTSPAEVAGFLGAETATPSNRRTMQISPVGANFEVMVTIAPEPTATGQYQVEAHITLFDRFGDFSGVEMALIGENVTRMATTDALGHVRFANVAGEQLPLLRLQIHLPAEGASLHPLVPNQDEG